MMTLGKRAKVFVPGQGWSDWMAHETAEALEAQMAAERYQAARKNGAVISLTSGMPKQPRRERETVIFEKP